MESFLIDTLQYLVPIGKEDKAVFVCGRKKVLVQLRELYNTIPFLENDTGVRGYYRACRHL
jgi:hypothetical protein